MAMDGLPPTQDALLEHSERAVYQAAMWTISMQVQAIRTLARIPVYKGH